MKVEKHLLFWVLRQSEKQGISITLAFLSLSAEITPLLFCKHNGSWKGILDKSTAGNL